MNTRPRTGLWALYAGGLLGPFGGAVVNTMLPEIADGLDTSLGTAASSATWYLLPFAAFMLVSGTVAGRWGEWRAVRAAYLVYAAASLLSALASTPLLFLAGRAMQGAANAFTTPLLISMLAALVPPQRRGRAMGIYASMQAAGTAFSPFIGGLAAAVDYRWAFVGSAVAAAGLAVVTPRVEVPAAQRPDGAPGRWRALANLGLTQAALVGWCLQFASTGLTILVAILASDRFGADPAQRGLIVAAFGVSGLLTGMAAGRIADRFGLRPMGVASLAMLGVGLAAGGFVPSIALLTAVTFVAGVGGTGSRILVQSQALRSTPSNPSGATSLALSVQFFGGAAAPVVLTGYHSSVGATFVATGAVALAGAALAAVHRTPPATDRREEVPAPAG